MYGRVLKPVTLATTENPDRLGSDELPELDTASFVCREKSLECQSKRKVSRWNSLGRSERNGRDIGIGPVSAGKNWTIKGLSFSEVALKAPTLPSWYGSSREYESGKTHETHSDT